LVLKDDKDKDVKIHVSSDSLMITTIIYWDIFKRRLSLYYVFFTKYGLWLLVIFAYMFYVKDVSFVKAGAFLIFGVMFISNFLLKELYYKKYNMALFNFKNKIVLKRRALDKNRKVKQDKRFF
jgi:hypothetical protein